MGEVTVRRAVREDLNAVAALHDEVDELHRQALPWLLREVEDDRKAEFLADYVEKPDHAMFVAVAPDGSLLGALNVFLRQPARAPIVRPTTVAEIDALCVRSAFRRRSVGTRLVNAALAWAAASGATRTELGVYEFNEAARAFWHSLGFGTLSRRLVRHATGDSTE